MLSQSYDDLKGNKPRLEIVRDQPRCPQAKILKILLFKMDLG